MPVQGQILSGKYKLLEVIGTGGMATVYKAMDISSNQTVAIKIMNSELSRNDELIQRFSWEAEATGRLSHRNIVRLYDAGKDGQTYFLAMEYVDGITLKELIKKKGKLHYQEAISIAIELCDALEHAHQNQIIHRDMKPQNIMCSLEGHYKITDFGISRLTSGASHLTKTGTIMGSVHYFSPEQAQGHKINVTSDLYSLGIILYEMLIGKPPYDADENIAIALMHIQSDIPDPKQIDPTLPDDFSKLIMKALAKSPQDRFQTAKEMKEALERLHHYSTQKKQTKVPLNSRTKGSRPTSLKSKMLRVFGMIVILGTLSIFGYKYAEATFLSKETNTEQQTPTQTTKEEEPKKDTELHNEDINLPNKEKKPEKEPSLEKKEEEQEPEPQAPLVQKKFIVVVGSFEQEENATRLSEKLQGQGIPTQVIESTVFEKTMYRVHTGKFPSRAQAEEHLHNIMNSGVEGITNAFITEIEEKNS